MKSAWLAVIFIFLAATHSQAADPKTRLVHLGLELDGAWAFLKDASNNPDAEVVGIADPDQEKIDRARKLFPSGVRFYRDYVKMLDELKPDAVISTTPNSQHLEIVRECAKRHVHVWFQKPMAISGKEAREMERLARESGIKLMINNWTLWSGMAETIFSKVKSGELGKIQRLNTRNGFTLSKALSSSYESYLRNTRRHGGGALIDQASYGISWAVSLLGRPKSVIAVGQQLNSDPKLKSEDLALVTLIYPDAIATIEGRWWVRPDTGDYPGVVEVSGPGGAISRIGEKVYYQKAIENNGTPGKIAEPILVDNPQPPFERQNGVNHFIDSIRNNRPIDPPHSASLNIIIDDIVDAAYESIRIGRTVQLPPA